MPSEREQKIKALAVDALKLWREARDSGWVKHAHTDELLEAVSIISHAYDIEHDELTAAQSRVEELTREAESMRGLLEASGIAQERATRERVRLEAVESSLTADNQRLQQRIEQLEEQRAQCDSALRSIRAYGTLPQRYVDEINEVLGE